LGEGRYQFVPVGEPRELLTVAVSPA